MSLALVVTVLLVYTSSVQAFSFCFSFGGGNNNRGRADYRADYYNYPPPGMGPAFYPAYPYSPVSPELLHGFYPPPPPPPPAATSAEPENAPRPTTGWPK